MFFQRQITVYSMDDDNTTNEIDQAILHALLKGKRKSWFIWYQRMVIRVEAIVELSNNCTSLNISNVSIFYSNGGYKQVIF